MKKLTCLLTLVLIALFAYEASAQNFTNTTGGTYTACATGKIVMRTTAGVFNGTAELGLASGSRIQGIVDWAYGGATQAVQNRYYTDLTVSGTSVKTFTDAYIGGVYTNSASSGARNYGTGTIHYDGAAQNITSESGSSASDGRYYNLVFEGSGAKTIVGGTTVLADNSLVTTGVATSVAGVFEIGKIALATASTVGSPFEITGATGAFKNGNSDIAFNGTVDLNAGGAAGAVMTIDGTGDATFNGVSTVTAGNLNLVSADGTANLIVSATGSLTLGNDANANIDLGAASRMIVTGSYANSFCAGTNVNYNVTSIVNYNSGVAGQAVASTVAANPYGNLWTDAGDKIIGSCAPSSNVYVAGNLAVAGGNFWLGSAANVAASTATLFMTDVSKAVVYNAAAHAISVDGPSEVVGAMRLVGGASQFAVATPYRFNNHGMTVNFASGTFAGNNYFEVLSHPATNPRQYDPLRDLNRKISLRYDISAFNSTVQAGYKASDIPGTWTSGYVEGEFRFWESNASGLEKIATGNAYNRSAAGTIHTVSLAGITHTATDIDGIMPALGNADEGFFSTNDLVLRAGPTIFYSIRDGRWSNPATWDEGAQPGSLDDAVVRHTVHAGFERASDNYDQPEQHPVVAAGLGLVRNITINNIAGSSLLWGGGVLPGDVSAFSLSTAGSITNNSLVGGVLASGSSTLPANTGAGDFDGMSIFTESSVITNNLINVGLMNNCGTVGIGD